MPNIRSNIDKIVKRNLLASKAAFKLRHPLTMFDEPAARRVIHKRVIRRIGASAWRPHQGVQECERRIRQGNAPEVYIKK